MAALFDGGGYKQAAKLSGKAIKTLEAQTNKARKRMGMPALKALVEFEVWRRLNVYTVKDER